MPRPINPAARTPADYARASRLRRQASTIEITAESRAHIATLRTRDGDPSDRATVARALREAVGQGKEKRDE